MKDWQKGAIGALFIASATLIPGVFLFHGWSGRSFDQREFESIRVGAPVAEVVASLGDPDSDSTSQRTGVRTLTWYDHGGPQLIETSYVVEIQDNHVSKTKVTHHK